MKSNTFDVVVVGAGISGLTAAAAAASDPSLRVALVTTGPGSFVFGPGWIKAQGISSQSETRELNVAISFSRDTTRQAGCPFAGDLRGMRHLPTLLGEFQSVMLAPATVWNSEPENIPTAIVGISGLSSFDQRFLAERLKDNANSIGLKSSYVARQVDLAQDFGAPVTLVRLAQRFDRELNFRAELCDSLRTAANGFERILVPGMLGLHSDEKRRIDFEANVGCIVSEIPTLPPSVPSLRVFHRLKAHLQFIGVELYEGFPVSKLDIQDGRCTALEIASPGRPMILHEEMWF